MKFIRYMLWSWVPFLLSRNFGLEGDDAGYLSTLFDLFGIVGVIVCGWLSDWLAKKSTGRMRDVWRNREFRFDAATREHRQQGARRVDY